MLSFLSSKRILSMEETLSKRRKRDEDKMDKSNTKTMKSFFEADLDQSHTPLPLEWQRCLDVKSGQVYFLNTRTQQRDLTDPRLRTGASDSLNPTPMSLDLELNLPSQYLRNNHFESNSNKHDVGQAKSSHSSDQIMTSSTRDSSVRRCPSWLSFEVDEQEMVTAVCNKCYMLVMMCKSSPSCPNCKNTHPTDTREFNRITSGYIG